MAIDWTKSMQQTFEFYKVDKNTWKDTEQLREITRFNIVRDINDDTLMHATFTSTKDYGEIYVRAYIVAIQNNERERLPLGTFLAQTPNKSFDGRVETHDVDGYSPLIELKNNLMPCGYSLLKGTNTLETACDIIKDVANAPVIRASGDTLRDNFCANLDDTYLSFLTDLIAYSKMSFDLNENGVIMFSPKTEIYALSPVWTYSDDENSIFYPDITDNQDLYGIPNVVEVLCQDYKGTMYVRVENNDPKSPISTVNRGRIVLKRDSDPPIPKGSTMADVEKYAVQYLKELSSIEHTIQYSHGFTPVWIGSCVRINYEKAGLKNIKAKVVSQNFDCSTGCKVNETAVYNTNLWEGDVYAIESSTY